MHLRVILKQMRNYLQKFIETRVERRIELIFKRLSAGLKGDTGHFAAYSSRPAYLVRNNIARRGTLSSQNVQFRAALDTAATRQLP